MLDPDSTTTRIDYTHGGRADAAAGVSYGALLAQTMMLVAIAIALFTVGTVIGGDYSQGTALALFIAGTVMLFAQSFVKALRTGLVGTTWLFLIAFILGLGTGPTLNYYLSVNPDVVAEAAGMTAVVVLGAACIGTFTAKDLAKWMKPVSLIVFATVLVSWVMLAFGEGGNPIVSAAIGLLSAVLIVIDFNYLRRRGTEDDVVWLATGIFVSILNIFLAFLNINSD